LGVLTEVEIFDCMRDNLRVAADRCRKLAWNPRRGWLYTEFRQSLELVEGACRQASAWRADTRWLVLGLKMAEAHRRAGGWLRDLPSREGRKVAHPMFQKLAEALDDAGKTAERLRTLATLRSGPILPVPLPLIRTESRPMQVLTPGGLILPPGYEDAA
jgi:hypothetical protein